MDDTVCQYIPWFSTPSTSVRTKYHQGDVACAVMTAEGQTCGNSQGYTRCREYCGRAMQQWQDHLLPILTRLIRNEVASVKDPTNETWVPATRTFSNAEAWKRNAEKVVVELLCSSRDSIMYHGTITVTPATRSGGTYVDIVTDTPGATDKLAKQLQEVADAKCHILSNDSKSISIDLKLKTNLQIGHAVSLGARLLLLDALSMVNQPFTIEGRYYLPDARSTKPVQTDAGVLSTYHGIRFGGVQ